jgi:hypothetical protein
MKPLTVETVEGILRNRTQAPKGIVRLAWKAARDVAEAEGNFSLSVQEGIRLIAEISLAESEEDILTSLTGWASRTGKSVGKNRITAALWAEIKKARAEGLSW